MVKTTSEITHSNVKGVNGAIFQAFAVHQNLHLDPENQLDVEKYISDLKSKLIEVEKGVDE
jgi:poly(ADP-ribose) glycohydrolase ARH3